MGLHWGKPPVITGAAAVSWGRLSWGRRCRDAEAGATHRVGMGQPVLHVQSPAREPCRGLGSPQQPRAMSLQESKAAGVGALRWNRESPQRLARWGPMAGAGRKGRATETSRISAPPTASLLQAGVTEPGLRAAPLCHAQGGNRQGTPAPLQPGVGDPSPHIQTHLISRQDPPSPHSSTPLPLTARPPSPSCLDSFTTPRTPLRVPSVSPSLPPPGVPSPPRLVSGGPPLAPRMTRAVAEQHPARAEVPPASRTFCCA